MALALVAVAFAMHPTTALWFGDLDCAARLPCRIARGGCRWLAAGAAVGAVVAIWAVTLGPLRGHLGGWIRCGHRRWRARTTSFPSDWNASFWLVNLSYLRRRGRDLYCLRRRAGLRCRARPDCSPERPRSSCVFLLSWPLMIAGVALALQLQTSRMFWMLDFLAAIYHRLAPRRNGAHARAPSAGASSSRSSPSAVAPRRRSCGAWSTPAIPIARIGLPQDNWTDAMTWISRTPADTYVLADPGHAWKYGTSVRVSRASAMSISKK